MEAQNNQSQYVSLTEVREQIEDALVSTVVVMGRLSQQDKNVLLKEGKQVIEVNDGGVYTTTIEWS
jgi:hypothetical protein